MIPIVITNDLALLSLVESLLREAGIGCLLADQYTSAIEGSIGAFPRRILILEADAASARACLIEPGLEEELERPKAP